MSSSHSIGILLNEASSYLRFRKPKNDLQHVTATHNKKQGHTQQSLVITGIKETFYLLTRFFYVCMRCVRRFKENARRVREIVFLGKRRSVSKCLPRSATSFPWRLLPQLQPLQPLQHRKREKMGCAWSLSVQQSMSMLFVNKRTTIMQSIAHPFSWLLPRMSLLFVNKRTTIMKSTSHPSSWLLPRVFGGRRPSEKGLCYV